MVGASFNDVLVVVENVVLAEVLHDAVVNDVVGVALVEVSDAAAVNDVLSVVDDVLVEVSNYAAANVLSAVVVVLIDLLHDDIVNDVFFFITCWKFTVIDRFTFSRRQVRQLPISLEIFLYITG